MGLPLETRGDFRDKIAAPDPRTVSPTADAEAAGTPPPVAGRISDDVRRATRAQAAVPDLDPNRAIAADARPGVWAKLVIPAIGAAGVLLFAALLLMSLAQ